jgi:hypothetical protein
MSFFAFPITEPFWLLFAGLIFLVSASIVQFRLSRKEKVEGQE